MISNIISDRKWYFRVGDKRYYNDVSALMAFSRDRSQQLEFVLDLPKLYAMDWSVEPKQNLNDLYDQLLNLIAKKYQNIILSYTGGTDSNTILDAIVRNNISNVKLVHVRNIVHDSNPIRKDEYLWIQQGLKERYGQHLQKLNITFQVHSLGTNNGIDVQKYKDTHINWNTDVYGMHEFDFVVPHGWLSGSWSKSSGVLDNLFAKQQVCNLMGFEKPRLVIIDDVWHWQPVSSAYTATPCHNEIWFFLNDIMPEIQIKLSHIKIQTIERIYRRDKIKYTGVWQPNEKYYVEINQSMGYHGVSKMFDTPFNKLWHGKAKSQKEYINDAIGHLDFHAQYFSEWEKYIDRDLLNYQTYTMHGVLGKAIPIVPVASDIVSGEYER